MKEKEFAVEMPKKIGIFGGSQSFDPFTIGHANVVKKAFQQLKLDKVIIVPTTVNYYRPDKRYLFTFDEKVRIIQNFTCGIRENVEIDTIEKDKDGSWRTIDLVQYFKKKFPTDNLYLIIGEDSYNDFKTWTRWEEILDYVRLAVANRGGEWTEKDIPHLSIDMGKDFEDCSATNTRNKLIEELIELYLSDSSWYSAQVL